MHITLTYHAAKILFVLPHCYDFLTNSMAIVIEY